MARSAVALNPASTPFFPGGLRSGEDDLAGSFSRRAFHEQDRSSQSSVSISPSEYRSVRSSPSPPQQGSDSERIPPRQQPSLDVGQRQSPPARSVEPSRADARRAREGSMLGGLDPLAEHDDSQETPGPSDSALPPSSGAFFPSFERSAPVAVNNGTSSYGAFGGLTSSSPVSSLDSGSQFASNDHAAQSFEAQLKASPLIHDILDRLVRCEYTTREMQRDVGEMQRKVNILVDRSLGLGGQPEFKDPFALNANGASFSSPSLNGPRPSIGNIAPNQANPGDDLVSVSQRLDMLTASVGQLTAASHQIHASISPLNNSLIGSGTPQIDLAPNQLMSPQGVTGSGMLGHGLPNRPDLRPSPRAPMRTWSAGTLDLPVRPPDPGRQDSLLRDKRRSVSGLVRRDSAGVLDLQNDNWMSGSPRDSGPMISKWEQLSLAPDLLRSLSKFGVGPPNKIQQRALPFLLRGADIIAQAPPTQERIAAYVIPAIQIAVTNISATQAQRMIRDLGGPIGVRSALGVGATTSDISQELRILQQNMPHIICGTPQKLHTLFTTPGGLVGSEVRFLVLDEVDQLIARNLHEFVFNIVKLLPPPRSRPLGSSTPTPNVTPGTISQPSFTSPFDSPNPGRRFSGLAPSPPTEGTTTTAPAIERQTALFSNTVPQDVLNLASAIQLREPVRVLVRRDGNVTHADTTQSSRGLRQFYLYLAFTAGGRSDPMAAAPGGGLGIIGSGRGASSAESAQAREWKLDALADLFDDVDVAQAVVHVGGMTALDSVVYKLASRGLEAVPLHGDMSAGTKLAALNKFRGQSSMIMRQPATKVLVVYDVQVKAPEVAHVPLIINYDLPKAVEEYAHRVAPAIASNYSRAGVIVNFVTATGGDVEMLRSIECFYKLSASDTRKKNTDGLDFFQNQMPRSSHESP
ncbi:Translation initiation factor [Mycena sanguinolenta]|uniref:RNA helicase n=1 Tax=Mycena sanguinolenta TaxID=230812 RepID=A0A8H6YA58_9AGAR|nr:Translation initiation factor [Mycena sanguinolenta]